MKSALRIISFILCLLVAIFLPKLVNTDGELNGILLEASRGFQIRQIILVILLFFIGLPSAHVVTRRDKDKRRCIFMALPMAVMLWVVGSFVCLTLGIDYSLVIMVMWLIVANIGVVLLFRNSFDKSVLMVYANRKNVDLCVLLMGVLLVVSAGVTITWVDSDGYYFITQLGKTIASQGRILPEMEYFLTHIFIGPSTLSSMAYMCKIDNFYMLHHMLVIDAWLLLLLRMHYICKETKKLLLYVVMFLSFPFVLYMSSQIISNTYVMISFIWLIELLDGKTGIEFIKEDYFFCILASIMLTWLRPDSIIAICVFVIALSWGGYRMGIWFKAILVPAAVTWFVWMTKVYIILKGHNGDLINMKSTLAVGMMILGSGFLAYVFSLEKAKKIIKSPIFWIGLPLAGTIALNLCFYKEAGRVFNTFLYNFSKFPYPIAGESGFWGFAIPMFLMLLWYVHCVHYVKINMFEVTFIWLFFVTYNMGLLRGVMLGSFPRGGCGDSFNRCLISYTPFLFYGLFKAIMEVVEKNSFSIEASAEVKV